MLNADDIYFRDLLRDARATAHRDAEGFQEILFAVEKLGAHLSKRIGDLNKYKALIEQKTAASPLHTLVPGEWRVFHLPFSKLYDLVRVARNDALHQGAYARHLTDHAVQLSLIIEDALMVDADLVSDYMVRGIVSAEVWQPVSFVRQQMLANSFSYLPVHVGGGWHLLSDSGIAKYLQVERKVRLAKSVEDALADGLALEEVHSCGPDTPKAEIINVFSGRPVLVVGVDSSVVLGIVTAFDLL